MKTDRQPDIGSTIADPLNAPDSSLQRVIWDKVLTARAPRDTSLPATSIAKLEGTHSIKIWDNLIEEAQALDATIVDALLCVEVSKVGEGGKHDTDLVVRLAIQLLHIRAKREREDRRADKVLLTRCDFGEMLPVITQISYKHCIPNLRDLRGSLSLESNLSILHMKVACHRQ